jgi:hypothetical protein
VVGITWLWGTMLMATFYPLIDGGIEQITQVYRGLSGKNRPAGDNEVVHYDGEGAVQKDHKQDDTHLASASSSPASTIGEGNQRSNLVDDVSGRKY